MIVHCAAAAVLVAMGLTLGCDNVGADSEASASAKPQAVIVDAVAVSRALGRDQDLQQQMEDAGQQFQKQIQQQQNKYQAEINAKRESFGDNPTEEQQQQLARMAQKANQNLRRLRSMAQQRMQQVQASLINQFRDELTPVVKQIARENDAQLVLINNGSVLWYDPAIDVTDQVIGALRAAENQAATEPEEGPVRADDTGDVNVPDVPDVEPNGPAATPMPEGAAAPNITTP